MAATQLLVIRGDTENYTEHPCLAPLLFVERGVNVGGHVRAGPILGTHDFAVEMAAASDDVCVGIHGGTVGKRNLFGGVTKCREGYVVSLQETLVGLRVVVHADAEDGAA